MFVQTLLLASILAANSADEHPAPSNQDASAALRGRSALLAHSYLKAEWRIDAYRNAWKLWGTTSAPDPVADPDGYARAFADYYGLHPAPYDNEGLPMGLRWSKKADGTRTGFQVDCMACHGGSIGGKSYVGLPNSTVDYELLLFDLFRADGRKPPLVPFTINTARGTVNAGMMSVVLLSVRNPDLSRRVFPLLLGANLPELDAPAWWTLKSKATMYQDGRTPAASVRSIMQFLLADKSRSEFEALEPTFADIHAYIRSIEPPAYPLAVDAPRAARGKEIFERSCARCHGTYGPDRSYPSKIVPIDVVGTDPARLMGISDRAVEHYNASWFAEHHRVSPARVGYQAPPLDGIWATAPYLHNGSIPTLHALLLSSERPARFTRPPSTGLEHYDARNVGWNYQVVDPPDPAAPRKPTREAHFVYDTRRHGLGNQGHTFGDKLTEEQRMELIEYLKTL
ncbi:c-type cytochrome [Aquisphaera insulae]|uniref:c-type cytochrome n=1 Tax=Aquisphaera insulae TaxID=2712864 RepID=UPI0013EC7C81|nr:c-type cytochrome [Aquisphaera insulae]